MLTVRGCNRSGNRSGPRSWIIVARMPERCGGSIQSVKCKTSKSPRKRSAGGLANAPQTRRVACANGTGQDALLDVQSLERLVEQAPASDADRSEGDDFAFGPRRLEHAFQRAEDVIADARSRMREGRDVVRDSHGAA